MEIFVVEQFVDFSKKTENRKIEFLINSSDYSLFIILLWSEYWRSHLDLREISRIQPVLWLFPAKEKSPFAAG